MLLVEMGHTGWTDNNSAFALFVFIRIPGCLQNEYKYSNYLNYLNIGYSNENFTAHTADFSPCLAAVQVKWWRLLPWLFLV
jgi:hypothetical protein